MAGGEWGYETWSYCPGPGRRAREESEDTERGRTAHVREDVCVPPGAALLAGAELGPGEWGIGAVVSSSLAGRHTR